MKNTPENKEIFFAQYYGQRIAMIDGTLKGGIVDRDIIGLVKFEKYISNHNNSYLDLIPLSSISIQDAIDIAKVVYPHSPLSLAVMREHVSFTADGVSVIFITKEEKVNCRIFIGNDGRVNFADMPSTVDHILRLKGYALKFGKLSVEDQLKYGWIKLRK